MYDENPYAPPAAEVLDGIARQDVEECELAGRITRWFGAVIDGLLIFALVAPWMYFGGYWEKAMSGQLGVFDQIQGMVVGQIAYLLLNAYLLARHGQTVGKRLLGMRIVPVADGKILPLWKLIVWRQLPIGVLGNVPFVGGIFGLVDCLLIFRQDRRCLHDLFAGTKVVRASD